MPMTVGGLNVSSLRANYSWDLLPLAGNFFLLILKVAIAISPFCYQNSV
jgi:hypothetical protein